ncbi:MAG TPA: PD-(D/E)XK nuclease family protein, partial [Bacteroidota bacterium]|nr:PD-(D/E)XK nuclease family protein [Bacteroidota bacterium]
LPYQTDYLNAILDILYQDNEGNYHICDWKTNLIQSKIDFELLCEHYSLQMKFYAYMVSFLNPNQNIMSARLLFTRLAKDNLHNENWTHLFEWNRQELQEFENLLNDYFSKIKSIDSLREYLISNL